jgi:hypothetical protein
VDFKKLINEGRQLLEGPTKVTHVVTNKHSDGRIEHNSSVSHHDGENHFHYHVGTLSLPDGSGESYALNTHQNGQPVNKGAGTEVYRKGYKKCTFDPDKAHQDTLRALQASFGANE